MLLSALNVSVKSSERVAAFLCCSSEHIISPQSMSLASLLLRDRLLPTATFTVNVSLSSAVNVMRAIPSDVAVTCPPFVTVATLSSSQLKTTAGTIFLRSHTICEVSPLFIAITFCALRCRHIGVNSAGCDSSPAISLPPEYLNALTLTRYFFPLRNPNICLERCCA